MAFDDLDLEFEDEEEERKKKNDAVQVDVDLEFHTPESSLKRPPPGAQPLGVVKKLDDARGAQAPAKRPPSAPQHSGGPAQLPSSASHSTAIPRSQGSSALKREAEFDDVASSEVVQLRDQMKKVEFAAEVKVAVAEFKTELLSELVGDTKLMEHQVNQLLVRIHAKHPDLKQEVLMIKKILADFTIKKRK